MAALSISDQGALLDLFLGFVFVVVALHTGETIVWAMRLKRWDIASVIAVSFLSVGCGLGLLLIHRLQHGVHFSDLLLALGGPLALLACVPTRCLRRRVCQWERYQLRHTVTDGRQVSPLNAPHAHHPLRSPRRATWPFHRNRQKVPLKVPSPVVGGRPTARQSAGGRFTQRARVTPSVSGSGARCLWAFDSINHSLSQSCPPRSSLLR